MVRTSPAPALQSLVSRRQQKREEAKEEVLNKEQKVKEVKLTRPRNSAPPAPLPASRANLGMLKLGQERVELSQCRRGGQPGTCPASPITGRWHVREL